MSQKTFTSALLLLSALLISSGIFAATFVYHPASTATNAPSAYLKASEFIKLTPAEFTSLSGKKLSFLEKLYFKSVQHRLRKEVKKNPEISIEQYYDQKKTKFKLDALWFVLGAILGPLAILFSYTSKQPKRMKKSALLGCIVFVLWFGFMFVF
jgi:hypothetical protein